MSGQEVRGWRGGWMQNTADLGLQLAGWMMLLKL